MSSKQYLCLYERMFICTFCFQSLSKFLCSPLHPNLPFCKQCMIFWILERGFDNERADGPHTVAATWNIVLCLVHTSICIGSLSNTVGGFFLQKIVLPKRFGGIGGFRPFPTLQKYFFAENLFADLGDITPPPPPRPLRKKIQILFEMLPSC